MTIISSQNKAHRDSIISLRVSSIVLTVLITLSLILLILLPTQAKNTSNFPQSPPHPLTLSPTPSLTLTATPPPQYHPTDSCINKKLLNRLTIGTGTLYATSVFGLYQLWYKDYDRSSFHFFNDNHEWMQIDKAGHATTSYHLGVMGYEALTLSGTDNTRAALIGGSLGLFYLTTVETFDGFSSGWGASGGDVIANVTGASAFIVQQLVWKEQRIAFKWSYHPTKYATYRPDLFGTNELQHMLKDYNGHTYWLSANISSFLSKQTNFPRWINIAGGYSATGMTGAFENVESYAGVSIPPYDRYRKYLISPDIDFTRIKTNSKALHFLLKTFSFIKIPMPALEFNNKGIKLHPLYF